MKNIIVFIIILALAANSFAQPEKWKSHFPKEKFAKFLNLTEEQEKKIEDLKYNLNKSVIDIRAKIEKNRLELKKLFNDSNIDEKKIILLTDENSKLQSEIKNLRIKNWLEIYKLLDKDQQKKWIKFFNNQFDRPFMKKRMMNKFRR